MKTNNLIIIFAVVLVIGGGAAFFGGMKYQESKTPARNGGQNQAQFRQRTGATGAVGTAVNGDVLNSDAKTLTVKLTDGSSKIVLLSDKTTVSQATASATTDIKTGQKVAVFGTVNPDGSVTAQNVQINPIQRGPGNGTGNNQ